MLMLDPRSVTHHSNKIDNPPGALLITMVADAFPLFEKLPLRPKATGPAMNWITFMKCAVAHPELYQ